MQHQRAAVEPGSPSDPVGRRRWWQRNEQEPASSPEADVNNTVADRLYRGSVTRARRALAAMSSPLFLHSPFRPTPPRHDDAAVGAGARSRHPRPQGMATTDPATAPRTHAPTLRR